MGVNRCEIVREGCIEVEERCFYEIDNDVWQGEEKDPGGLIVVMIQCRNLGLIDEVQHCKREECNLYSEEMVDQLAYFHNVIINWFKGLNPTKVIIMLKKITSRGT